MRLTLVVLVTLAGCAAHARAPEADPTLDAMVIELGRASELVLPGYDRPYFVALSVHETERWELGAKLGAVVTDETSHKREGAAEVRVGSWELDNSEDPEQDFLEEGVFEPAVAVPIADPDPTALRHTLWLLADLRYKQALASYLRLKGQGVYKVDEPDRSPSFSPAPPVVAAAPRQRLAADTRARWERLVRTLSARLAADPAIFDSEVKVELAVETRWLTTSEGTRLRTVRPSIAFHAAGWTRADDGMLLDHSVDLYAPAESQLPDDAALTAAVDQLVALLLALRNAPVLEPYTGPAILEGRASGVFFHEVLGHRLEGHRQGDDDGQTFAKYLGQPIVPTFLTLVDDPTLATSAGVPLNGAYTFDDEGVRAERTLLIDRGILRGFLNARHPGPGADRSNGHGRAQGTRRPVARQANLLVLAEGPLPASDLRARLLAEVRRQGRPFGLILRDLAGGSTNTSSFGYQAFKGTARTVYKVDAETGDETLVRGVDLVGTPLATLGKIVAASDEVGVFNGYCGAESGMVPVSVVAPAVLFSEVELQRTDRPRARGPILPSPVLAPPTRSSPSPASHGAPR